MIKALQAIRTSVLLSILFVVVYGGTNWLTALRHDVGVMVMPWENGIPFVPWLIVPYMSIDLFFVSTPFLCKTDEELRTLAKRITCAILTAAACFLIFPLRFSFERPSTSGWLGVVFDSFRTLDRPFNQLPSLHIALLIILADRWLRHTRGALRLALAIWFILISASTVLTWQHHIIDVIGGFLLGALCFYLFPNHFITSDCSPNRPIGWLYASAAIATLSCGLICLPWGGLLIWPASGLALVARAYFGSGPAVFRKSCGRIPWYARVWLAPVLLGQHLSLIHYRRQCRAWDEITPNLWIGRKLTRNEAHAAIAAGAIATLDLTGEFSEATPLLDTRYLNLPVLDLTAPTNNQFAQAIAFIDQHIDHGVVFVHCKIGYSRSAAVAMAWLMHRGIANSTAEAATIVRAARPSVVIRPEITPAVEAFIAGSES